MVKSFILHTYSLHILSLLRAWISTRAFSRASEQLSASRENYLERPFPYGFNFVRQITWNGVPHRHNVL